MVTLTLPPLPPFPISPLSLLSPLKAAGTPRCTMSKLTSHEREEENNNEGVAKVEDVGEDTAECGLAYEVVRDEEEQVATG